MPLEAIAAFWAVSFVFVLTPGADWAYAITAGLRHRTVVPAVTGMLTGHLVMTAVVAAGVAALVTRSPAVLTALTTAGALYLVWLGITMLLAPSTVPQADAEQTHESWVRRAGKGLGISGLNPKVFLLFLALLPQFTDTGSPLPLPVQIVLLGCVHVLSCAVIYTVVGMGARVVLRSRPSAARVVSWISALAMIAIGVVLLIERIAG